MRATRRSLLLFVVVCMACETAVEPKTEFLDLPVLFSVITPSVLSNTVHTVVLTRSYSIEGTRPPDVISERPITGATVQLSVDGRTFPMIGIDDTLRRTATDTLVRHLYRSPAIRFLPGQTATVSAFLPDGKKLLASTTVPPFLFFNLSYSFPHGITTSIRAFLDDKAWTLRWEKRAEHLYWPRLTITYQETLDSGGVVTRSIEVPTDYAKEDGIWKAVYPDYTWNDNISYTFDAIDSAMVNLSAGNPDKQRFRVISASFSVHAFDIHLSRYYASRRGSLDEYSIRTDQFVYSNIQGGLGLFGSQSTSSFEYEIDQRYTMSFGYRVVN